MKDIIADFLADLIDLPKNEIISSISPAPDIRLGDFAFPCFILSKKLNKSPTSISQELTHKLIQKNSINNKKKYFEKIESVGPYINFFLDRKTLAQETIAEIGKKKSKYGSQKNKRKVIIEFPSPNTNKPLHLGHVRNLVLGQSITNILKFCGNEVKIVNLNNDRGIHICKSMLAYQKFSNGDTPEKSKMKSDHFVGNYYVKFALAAKENPSLEQEAQEMLKQWESKNKEVLSLWKKMNSWALSGFNETYSQFNFKPDKEYFESDIYYKGKSIILNALKKGILEKNKEGAVHMDLTSEGLGDKILLRSDGTSIYITQDIYLAFLKQKEFSPDLSIIVSASEQNYHFKVLFRILKILNYPNPDGLFHLSYGMVNLESGRMKSREGTVVDADDILKEVKSLASEEIKKRFSNVSKKDLENRSKAISLAAIRYYFLRVERIRDVVFKPEESISFEGNTGPYLLYSYARARSIIRKSKKKNFDKFEIPSNISEKEKALIVKLASFPEIVDNAYDSFAPNLIANYSFELAQIFNEFYHSEQVINSENEVFHLAVVNSFCQVLSNALNLLGIEPIEYM